MKKELLNMKTGPNKKSNFTISMGVPIVKSNIETETEIVNNKPTATAIQSDDNFMVKFPNVLRRSILDWESLKREATKDKYFDAYRELSLLVNLSESSIRKYTNEYNPEFPTVLNLVKICKAINNYKPIQFINDYTELIK